MPIQSTHPDYDNWVGRWNTCRDAVEGEYAIKAGSGKYLPPLSAHLDPKFGIKAYDAYKNRALWFGATDRTLNGYVGAIMRRDPSFEVPDLIKDRLEDVTDAGQNAVEFVHAQVKELLTTGRYGLLVDKSGEDTEEGEPAFIKLYYPENIRNWMTDRDGNLITVVLEESVCRPRDDDPYDIDETSQLRELRLAGGVYYQQVWTKKQQNDTANVVDSYEPDPTQLVIPTMRGVPLDYIPFIFVSCDRDAMSCSKPPIMDLVNANINHYQLDADYRHGLHFTALPTPVFTGVDDARDYFLGSEVAINLRNADSKAFFLEFQGLGLSAIKDAMEERKSQMAALGASLIQQSKTQGKGIETAEAARIQHSGETSLLSTVVGRVEEAFETALEYMAEWEGVTETEGIEVTLNRDFIDATLTAADITSMVAAWQSGALPVKELYWNFQRGGVVNPATTVDDFTSDVEAAAAKKQADAAALAKASAKPAVAAASDSSDGGTEPSKPAGGGGVAPAGN